MSSHILVKLYKRQPYQRLVHDGLAAHSQDAVHVVKAVRQCGKSLMLENILIKASTDHPNQTSVLLAPTFKQGKKIYKSIVKRYKGTPLYGGSDGQDLVFTFCNGSEIKILSAEQGDNIRGETVTKYGVLCIDEAAYMKDDVYYAATPFTNAHRSPTVIVSTPRFRTGFFYDLYTEGEKGTKNIYSYDFAKFPNPYITAEKLEMYRRKMPVNLYRADYLGEWMEANSDVFGDFQAVMSNTVTSGVQHIAGLDWGVGRNAKNDDSDSTALSIFNEHRQQVRLYAWNDLNAEQTVKAITDAIREYSIRLIVVETNSIGSVYLDLLRKAISANGLPCVVREFTTTNDTKREIIEAYIVEVQNRTVQLLDDPEQKIQLSAFQMERTKSGLVTYNAAKGYHDDIIMATAFALYGLRSPQYAVL